MSDRRPDSPKSGNALPGLAVIGAVVIVVAGGFAYAGGWLSPDRLTPQKLVTALAPPGGPALGHRRNHAKGICFTGSFQANGAGQAVSAAPMFASGSYPALGRFNIGAPVPTAEDSKVRVRGLGLQITAADGSVWRSATINAPVFPVGTPAAFYELLQASGSKDPNAMKTFAGAHPELAGFGAWAQGGPWTGSYAEERYNSLDAFLFVDAQGAQHPVRWSFVPKAEIHAVEPQSIAADGLEQEITSRVAAGPQSWSLIITLGEPGDPTADPSKAWPDGRRTIDAGTLRVDRIVAEADGPCRDVNFDPTVLPPGITVSDDPFPAARSAAYARSFDLRTAEANDYPRTGGKP